MKPAFTPIGPQASFEPLPSLAEAEPGFGEYFGAASGNVIRDSPTSSLFRMAELSLANRELDVDPSASEFGDLDTGRRVGKRSMSAEQASALAEEAGVKVDFGTASYTRQAVEIMIDRAKRRAVRDSVIASYNPSMGMNLGVALLTSLADPLNIGAAFIPFAGQARYAAALEGAATFAGRTGVRAGLGAVEGLGGATVIEPFISGAAIQEGRDYSLADSLRNLMFGAAFGSGLHMSLGGIGEKLFKREYGRVPVKTPADIVHRIPQEINEAAFRATISDMIHGRPVAASDVIDLFMRNDPEAARSISYAATLRRDGPEIEDTLTRVEWWKERLSGKPSKPASEDFVTWVRSKGGLRDEGGELERLLGGKPDLPSSVYISKRGASRTTRGMVLKDLYNEAVKEGFVENYEQFINALRAKWRGTPLRKQFRKDEEKQLAQENEFRTHMQALLDESGVSKNANRTIKARAIVRREQHLIASERARISQAVDRLLKRNEEYKDVADGSKVEPPQVFKPEKIKTQKAVQEPVAVGDTVNIVSGEERIIANAEPVKITRILTDPVYGTYGFVEGSSTGIPIKDLVRVGEPASKPVPSGAERLVETPPAERDALTVAELDASTAQYRALQQQTERRLNAMLENLPPETAATIKAQLSRIDDDATALEKLYNSAVSCLLNPKT